MSQGSFGESQCETEIITTRPLNQLNALGGKQPHLLLVPMYDQSFYELSSDPLPSRNTWLSVLKKPGLNVSKIIPHADSSLSRSKAVGRFTRLTGAISGIIHMHEAPTRRSA